MVKEGEGGGEWQSGHYAAALSKSTDGLVRQKVSEIEFHVYFNVI